MHNLAQVPPKPDEAVVPAWLDLWREAADNIAPTPDSLARLARRVAAKEAGLPCDEQPATPVALSEAILEDLAARIGRPSAGGPAVPEPVAVAGADLQAAIDRLAAFLADDRLPGRAG
jgi:hypothetical protein